MGFGGNMDVKNVIGLEKPLEKLIETISDGVGVVSNHIFKFDVAKAKRIGKAEAEIERNKITLNKNNIFNIEVWRKDKLRIINQFNEPIEIIAHKTGEIELNGVFYCGRNRFEASPKGLKIN